MLTEYSNRIRPERRRVVFSLILSLLQTASVLPIAFLVRKLFDDALPNRDIPQLYWLTGGIFLLFLGNALITLANRALSLRAIKSIIAAIRTELGYLAITTDRTTLASENSDAHHTKIVTDTERIDCMASAMLTQILPGTLVVTGLSVLLVMIDARLSLLLGLCIPILLLCGRMLGRRVQKAVRTFHTDFSHFSDTMSFALTFNELIRLTGAEKLEQGKQASAVHKLKTSSTSMAWLMTAYGVIQGNLLMIASLIVLLVGGIHVIQGTMTIGSLISFSIAMNIAGSHVRTILNAIPTCIEGFQSLNTLRPLLATLPKKAPGRVQLFENRITFDAVHFAHNESFSLRDVSFTITEGTKVGIFGKSGAGKSTIIHLLLGTLTPEHGTISVHEHSLGDIDLAAYRASIGILPQQPLLFRGTIRENLCYGLVDVPSAALEAACKDACIHEYIAELPAGYDTMIGSHGAFLSGGQRQRIAIARALLRNPKLLILDEPDNNLDEHTMRTILENISRRLITTIIVSHNRALYSNLDSVLLVENGNVYTPSL